MHLEKLDAAAAAELASTIRNGDVSAMERVVSHMENSDYGNDKEFLDPALHAILSQLHSHDAAALAHGVKAFGKLWVWALHSDDPWDSLRARYVDAFWAASKVKSVLLEWLDAMEWCACGTFEVDHQCVMDAVRRGLDAGSGVHEKALTVVQTFVANGGTHELVEVLKLAPDIAQVVLRLAVQGCSIAARCLSDCVRFIPAQHQAALTNTLCDLVLDGKFDIDIRACACGALAAVLKQDRYDSDGLFEDETTVEEMEENAALVFAPIQQRGAEVCDSLLDLMGRPRELWYADSVEYPASNCLEAWPNAEDRKAAIRRMAASNTAKGELVDLQRNLQQAVVALAGSEVLCNGLVVL